MPIHNNSLFDEFLGGVSVERAPRESPSVVLSDQPRPLYLAYPHLRLQLESVLAVLRKELAAAGCLDSRDIALATLALIAETRPNRLMPVVHANQRLSRTRRAKLHLAIVTARATRSPYHAKIGPYELQPFDPKVLQYWGERTRSSWPIDLARFQGHLAIHREPLDLTLLDWSDEESINCLRRRWSDKEITECVIDAYFQAVFALARSRIGEEISEHLLVLEAASMVSDHSKLADEFLSTALGLFVMDLRSGWALMRSQIQVNLNTTPASVYSDCREWLNNELGFSGFEDGRPLDGTASKFCSFLRRAQRHRLLGHGDEAFLHFIVALDLLFGQRASLADSVACRAATVTHRALGLQWADQRKRVQQLYDARSRYVHEGLSPAERDLRDAEGICLEVLWALLATCAQSEVRHAEEWLKGIDYVLAATQAERTVGGDELGRLGIALDKVTRSPPNRVLDDLERAAVALDLTR